MTALRVMRVGTVLRAVQAVSAQVTALQVDTQMQAQRQDPQLLSALPVQPAHSPTPLVRSPCLSALTVLSVSSWKHVVVLHSQTVSTALLASTSIRQALLKGSTVSHALLVPMLLLLAVTHYLTASPVQLVCTLVMLEAMPLLTALTVLSASTSI
jgi:hypothetical protein